VPELDETMRTYRPTLYRAFARQQDTHVPRLNTWRPPGNVPYIVDNLWEWVRPEAYPTRRTAAFASPSSEEAKADGRTFVYRLNLPEGSVVAQLNDFVDSKFHPEVNRLRIFIHEAFGRDWFSMKLADKSSEASLFCPCLSKEEVDSIVSNSSILSGPELSKEIRYWNDIRLIKEEPLAPSGEVFFAVPVDGYNMVNVE